MPFFPITLSHGRRKVALGEFKCTQRTHPQFLNINLFCCSPSSHPGPKSTGRCSSQHWRHPPVSRRSIAESNQLLDKGKWYVWVSTLTSAHIANFIFPSVETFPRFSTSTPLVDNLLGFFYANRKEKFCIQVLNIVSMCFANWYSPLILILK